MREEIKKVLSKIIGVSLESIDENFSMQSCSQWDSLTQMQLMAALEESFELPQPLSLDEMITMTSLKAIEGVLAGKTSS